LLSKEVKAEALRRWYREVFSDTVIWKSLSKLSDDELLDYAEGFNNLGSASVNIPQGTVVGTTTGTPVNFHTTAAATLPGGVGARVTDENALLRAGERTMVSGECDLPIRLLRGVLIIL
jgi:hypothetical protein